jgi:uncharacterized protein YdeI (YjbR/CyaY-like superfamily)
MQPVFFSSPADFRKWLEKNHLTETELIVGYYKVYTGKPSMSWSESVDQALCFGWIDGIRRSINDESYCIRFTPRKSTSIWSTININKVETMIKQGLMQPAGIEAYKKRKVEKSAVYSFENENKKLPDSFENKFRKNAEAWNFFSSQAPSYQKTKIHWVLSAKQDETKLKRLEKLIEASQENNKLF